MSHVWLGIYSLFAMPRQRHHKRNQLKLKTSGLSDLALKAENRLQRKHTTEKTKFVTHRNK
jgi:hypothetical protein